MQFDSFLTIEDDPLALNRPHILAVASRLRHHGIGILPMETVYVLTGLADEFEVQERMRGLRRMKDHPTEWRPFTNLIASVKMLLSLVELLPPETIKLLGYLLPGPLTVVLPANDDVPKWMCDEQRKIWIRIPQHPFALALAREIERPLAVTRAAIYPDTGSRSPNEVPDEWNDKIDFLWDGGETPMGKHSTVIEFSGEKLLLLRSGAFPFEELQRVCEREGFAFDWTWQDRKLPAPYRILFVCNGNICRSAMAEALLRHRLKKHPEVSIAISSAGTEVKREFLPIQTVVVMQEMGINIRSHRPYPLQKIDLESYDLVLAIGNEHIEPVREHLPVNNRPEVTKLSTFPRPPESSQDEVKNPESNTVEAFRQIREDILHEIDRILPELILRAQKKHG